MVLSTELGPRKVGRSQQRKPGRSPSSAPREKGGLALPCSQALSRRVTQLSPPTPPGRAGEKGRTRRAGARSGQLSSRHWNCRYGMNYSPGDTRQLQASFPLPTSLSSPPLRAFHVLLRPFDTGGVPTTEARGKLTCPRTVPPLSPKLPAGRLQPRRGKGRPRLRSVTRKLKAAEGREAHGKQAATW